MKPRFPPSPLPARLPACLLLVTAAGTVDFLRNLEMSEDELSKAIIGTIGDVDSYQLPGAAAAAVGNQAAGRTLP